ncbi:MAG: HAMP domain-containing histidine kinase [Fretibacterium sp.]|nr:HAMP domain-containing histidine kinase [Fretibacterium sp.]
MRRRSLRSILSTRFALLVLAAISLISIAANILINAQFEAYVEERQKLGADGIARNISSQYDGSAGWNADYVHGMGMYALSDGYIIKLLDGDGRVVWDAENHDMSLCHEVMSSITILMRRERPDLKGRFTTHRYDLTQKDAITGYLDISYYSPYSMREDDFHFISTLNRILVAVGGVAMAGAAILGVLLANGIVRPLADMTAATKKISGGDYAIRLDEKGHAQEVCELTQAVNQMAGALEEQEAMRKRLTSDVAHELRTPVANLSSYMEMMIDGVWAPTPERLQSCGGELQRLSGLISDLERLRQVEDEKMELHKADVDLLALSGEVMKGFESQLHEKGLQGRVTGSVSAVPADSERIKQVIANLLSNSVKYSRRGGTVHIVIEDTKDYGVIRVEDDGIGISAGDLPYIFERFYRADRSRTRRTGGAGIGLTIARAIMRAHGGKITVESERDSGSKFSVFIPKSN